MADAEAPAAEPEGVADRAAPPRDDKHADDDETRRDRRALVVRDLAGARGERAGGDVEPGQPRDPAAHEPAEHDRVPDAAEAEREAEHRGRDAERDDVGERVEVGAEDG